MITFESIIEAYHDCMRRKQSKQSAVRFDCDREEMLWTLYEDIVNHRYAPSPSIAFVVLHPKPREVFAADFRDRIVHHWIALRLEPILRWMLIPNTFSCIEKRGTSAMQNKVYEMAQQNPTLWVAKVDISGFFNSINKDILRKKMQTLINQYYQGEDKDELLWLTCESIFNDPSEDCKNHSPQKLWKLIPPNRTLFNDKEKGLAIGNLVSQLYANYYLNDADHTMQGMVKGYFRYVDDIVLIDTKENICKAIPVLREMLTDVGLTINPHKYYMQPLHRGVDIVGKVVKGKRLYTRKRTVKKVIKTVSNIPPDARWISTINSYLGLMKQGNNYKNRIRLARALPKWWIHKVYFDYNFTKVIKQ